MKIFKTYFIVAVFLLKASILTLYAQNQIKIDSLKNLLEQTTTPDIQIEITEQLYLEHITNTPLEALKCAFAGFELASTYNIDNTNWVKNIAKAYYYCENYEQSIEYCNKVLEIYEELKDNEEIAEICNTLGNCYGYLGNYQAALNHFQKAYKYAQISGQTDIISSISSNIGVIYFYWEKYDLALEYYKKALDEEWGNTDVDKKRIANFYNNIGEVYFQQKKHIEAIKYYQKSLDIGKEIDDKGIVSVSLNLIGEIYLAKNNNAEAMSYFFQALEIQRDIGDSRNISITLLSIANAYKKDKKYQIAKDYYNQSLLIANDINISETIKMIYFELSDLYFLMNDYENSLLYYKKYSTLKDTIFNQNSNKLITEIQTKYETEKIEKELKLKNLQLDKNKTEINLQKTIIFSFSIIFILIIIFISIFFRQYRQKKHLNIKLKKQNFSIIEKNEELYQQKEEIKTQAEDMQNTNRELEKLLIVARETDNAISIYDRYFNIEWGNDAFANIYNASFVDTLKTKKFNLLKNSNSKNIKTILNNCITSQQSITYQSKHTNKKGEEIWVQTTLTPIFEKNILKNIIAIETEITTIKEAEIKISEQNAFINSSIRYAQTIQEAILPNSANLNKLFRNFIVYKPKDVVSGDFYWFYIVDSPTNLTAIISVIDCTGHGIPGAFMSLIGNSLLNKIVKQQKIYDPKKILSQLNIEIRKSLKQDINRNMDGMDMCLCSIEKTDKTNSKIIFSGAKNPLYYYKTEDKKLLKLIGARKSIGGFHQHNKIKFTNQEIILQKGDLIYLTTDGYIDQNNEERKRFGTKRLINVLSENATKELSLQKQILETELNKWQKEEIQLDDITIVGIKI